MSCRKYKVVHTHGSPQLTKDLGDLGCGEPTLYASTINVFPTFWRSISYFLSSKMSAPPLKGIKVVELAGLAPGSVPILD